MSSFLQPNHSAVFEIQFLFECYIQGAKPNNDISNDCPIEQISLECRNSFAFLLVLHQTVVIGSKKNYVTFSTNRNQPTEPTRANRDERSLTFPALCAGFMHFLWILIGLLNCLRACDWLEWWLWFWFYYPQLKTAITMLLVTNLEVKWNLVDFCFLF